MGISYDFWQQHSKQFLNYGQTYSLILTGGQGATSVLNAALPSLVSSGEQSPSLVADERFSRRASFTSPVDLETTALMTIGIGVAIAGAATIALMLRAEQRLHERDKVGLRSLGFTSPQFAMVAALRNLPAALAGGAIAFAGAVALSYRFPIGIGRQLELDRGLRLNVAVIVLGTLATVLLVVTNSALASRTSYRRNRPTQSRPTSPRPLRRAGTPTDVALGAHIAFRNTVGGRSIITAQGVVGGVIALVVMGTVGMWLGGVNRLHDVPARHGWPWDAAIGDTDFALAPATIDRLAADPRIVGQTSAAFGQATLDGLPSELFAVDAAGTAPPVIVDGRLPVTAHEVAIGTRILHRLGVDTGDTVSMALTGSEFESTGGGATRQVEMTVVGTALAPIFGESDLGDVSIVTLDAIRDAGGDPSPHLVVTRFGGADQSAIDAQLSGQYSEEVTTDIIPARIINMNRVRSVPLLGIALAGGLGTITLAYVIVAGIRLHRRDLAVLRAIGLEGRRLRGVLIWHGLLITMATVAIGVPLSLLAGASLWRHVADGLGVQRGAVIPVGVLLLAPASLPLAVVTSLFASHHMRRSPVADALRAE